MFEEQLYIRFRGKVQGPFSPDELRQRAKRGRFSRIYHVSTDGMNWVRASEYPELFPPPPPLRMPQQPAELPGAASQTVDASEADSYELLELPTDQASEADDASIGEQAPAAEDSPAGDGSGESDQIWHYARDSQQYGPESFPQLQFLASTGQIEPTDLVWTDGMPDWIEAYRIEGLFDNSGSFATRSQQQWDAESAVTSPMAIGSFVLGLLGTSLLFFVGSIAAVVFGHVAMRQIRDSEETLSGRGMALAGLILGYIVIVATTLIGVIVLCLYLLRDTLSGSG